MKNEANRLERLGSRGWTEYQVLSLNQLLVDFLKEDELKGRARSSLEDLFEYTEWSSSRHDPEHYVQWEERINEAIDEIDKSDGGDLERDQAAERLRAELRTLLEHVADYDQYWDQGSVTIRILMTCGVVTIPLLVSMGLLPLLHPAGAMGIGIMNWGLLGISGALAAVLLNLHKSDLLYVGSTKGREAIWRAILGAALGLVAGILMYSMIAGGLLAGDIFPSVEAFPNTGLGTTSNQIAMEDVARSIFWGVFSGFSFEWVFDRLRSATKEGV